MIIIDRYLRIDGECSEARTRPKVGSGVRQGCPLLLVYHLLSTLNSLSNKQLGYREMAGGRLIKALRFDDE